MSKIQKAITTLGTVLAVSPLVNCSVSSEPRMTTQQYTQTMDLSPRQVFAFKGVERLMQIPEDQGRGSEAVNASARSASATINILGLAASMKLEQYDTTGVRSINTHLNYQDQTRAKKTLSEIIPYVADLHYGNADGKLTDNEVDKFWEANSHLEYKLE
jgi:hypothetical protein